jgi:hypothetical protein
MCPSHTCSDYLRLSFLLCLTPDSIYRQTDTLLQLTNVQNCHTLEYRTECSWKLKLWWSNKWSKNVAPYTEPRLQNRVHESLTSVPAHSRTNPIHIHVQDQLHYSRLLHLGLPSVRFPSGFHERNWARVSQSVNRATCCAHLTSAYSQ